MFDQCRMQSLPSQLRDPRWCNSELRHGTPLDIKWAQILPRRGRLADQRKTGNFMPKAYRLDYGETGQKTSSCFGARLGWMSFMGAGCLGASTLQWRKEAIAEHL